MTSPAEADPLVVALLDAVLAALAFLEHSGDDVVDPDDAVRAMEDISHPLFRLEPSQRQRLINVLTATADPQSWDRDLRDSLLATLRQE